MRSAAKRAVAGSAASEPVACGGTNWPPALRGGGRPADGPPIERPADRSPPGAVDSSQCTFLAAPRIAANCAWGVNDLRLRTGAGLPAERVGSRPTEHPNPSPPRRPAWGRDALTLGGARTLAPPGGRGRHGCRYPRLLGSAPWRHGRRGRRERREGRFPAWLLGLRRRCCRVVCRLARLATSKPPVGRVRCGKGGQHASEGIPIRRVRGLKAGWPNAVVACSRRARRRGGQRGTSSAARICAAARSR